MKLNTRLAVYATAITVVSCFGQETRSTSNPGPDVYDGRNLIVDGTVDSDGDGRVGDAEDNDSDNVFSTLAAALAVPVESGARIITIIGPGFYNPPNLGSGGLFGETAATVPDATTIQAAPGVFAVLDGHAASDGRTVSLGLRVTGRVTLRGIVLQQFATGIAVAPNSRVVMENVVLANNRVWGLVTETGSHVTMKGCSVLANGWFPKFGLGQPGPVSAGGAQFDKKASGFISQCLFAGNHDPQLDRVPARVLVRNSDVVGEPK
jgi:hypothetical protein